MTTLTVKAAPGLRVPYEDNARRYITDDKPISVLETTYYLRRLTDKELIPCEAEPVPDRTAPAPADAAPAPDTASPSTDQIPASAEPATDPTAAADQVEPVDAAPARATRKKGA